MLFGVLLYHLLLFCTALSIEHLFELEGKVGSVINVRLFNLSHQKDVSSGFKHILCAFFKRNFLDGGLDGVPAMIGVKLHGFIIDRCDFNMVPAFVVGSLNCIPANFPIF